MGRYYEYTRNSYGYPLYFKIFRNTCNELLRAAYIVVQSERHIDNKGVRKMVILVWCYHNDYDNNLSIADGGFSVYLNPANGEKFAGIYIQF